MSESFFVVLLIFKLILLGVFNLCYVLGGRSNKWLRGWLGGITFAAGIILLSGMAGSFQWPSLALLLLYPFGLRLGYGSDQIIGKVLRRGIYGGYFGLVGLFCGWIYGEPFLGLAQFFIALTACVLLGVFNPVRAVDEEAMIALAITIHIPFMF